MTEVLETVRDLLRQRAAMSPDSVAMVATGRAPMTLGEFARQCEAVGWRLRRHGIGPHDLVAVAVPAAAPEGGTAILGAQCAGGALAVSTEAPASEVRSMFSRANVRALLAFAGMESPARQVALELGLTTIDLTPDPDGPTGALRLPDGWDGQELPDPPLADDTGMIGTTSGTTSLPRMMPRSQRSTATGMAGFGLNGADPGAAIAMAPMYTPSGYGTLGSTVVSGDKMVFPASLDPAHLLGQMAEHGVTVYIGNPVIHEALLDAAAKAPATAARCRLRLVFSGGTALPVETAADLERTFGCKVLLAYGMTETNVISVHELTAAPGKEGTVGKPLVPLRIVDEDGRELGPNEVGEIQVQNREALLGYIADPEANAQAIAGDWFRTGDLGFIDDDGYLTIQGRLKEMINRGTLKVSPQEVEVALMEHPGIERVAVFPIPHASRGEEVAAAVVRADPALTADEVRDHAIARLSAHKVPRQVFFVDQIPTRLGKVPRLRLAEILGVGAAAPARRTTDVDLTPTEAALAQVWAEQLEVDGQIAPDDDFFILGGDSLRAVQMALEAEAQLGVRLTASDLLNDATLRGLAQAIDAARSQDRSGDPAGPVLTELQPGGDLDPVVWVHDGVGSVFSAGAIAFHLGSRQPVLAIEPPGMDGVGAPEPTVEEMADSYARLLEPHGKGPWVIGGHSFGGVVAYELARRLDQAGHEVRLVVLVDSQLRESLPKPVSPTADRLRRWREAGWSERPSLVARFVAHKVRPPVRPPRGLDIWATPEAVADTVLSAAMAYQARPWRGAVLYIKARDSLTPDAVEPWRALAGRLTVAEVDGDHAGVMREPFVGQVARAVQEELRLLEPAR